MRILFIIPIVFLSCKTNTTQEKNINKEGKLASRLENKINDIEEKLSTRNHSSGCYWQILQRDTFVASLAQNGQNITGKLTFNNFEKDKSTGTVSGSQDGDVLKLWYNFQSEGMQSVMEVWFKKQGDALLRGTGPMANKGDTSYFSNSVVIEYSSGQQLNKVDCASLPAKYK